MKDDPLTQAAVAWWRTLHDSNLAASRAAKARLKRCQTPLDALLLRETHDLLKALVRAGYRLDRSRADHRVALLAMALARVAPASGPTKPFALALGQSRGGEETQVFSPLRFTSLMRTAQARDWEALARALRRALAILGDTSLDAAALARDILCLDDRTLRRWTYEYWQTATPPGERAAELDPPPAAELDATP